MITVTKPYIPDRARLFKYIERALDSRWLTNDGPLVRELTERLGEFLGVENLLLVGNGTLGLQLALRLASCTRILTTPFSFPATSSAAVWADIQLVYGDIDRGTFNLVPPEGENNLLVDGVLATHVFGNPCDVECMARVAKDWEVPLIYDAAHTFGVKIDGSSLLRFGDMSVLSFHATKIFHSVEGGAVTFADSDQYEMAKEMINFGFDAAGRIERVGINAKMNEFEAAMGLAVLHDINTILNAYRVHYEMYDSLLDKSLTRQLVPENVEYNYSYFPICFPSEGAANFAIERLNRIDVYPRKYFSPSLDEVELYGVGPACEVSRSIAARIVCLPIYVDLPDEAIRSICNIINMSLD